MILDTGKVITCVHTPENVCVHALCVFPYGCILRVYCMFCVCACTTLCIIIITASLFFFTASEYYCWVLYLSLPILEGLLPDPYFTHYSLLVAGMHILLGQSISFHSLQMAEKYLLRFYEMRSPLYGESSNA